MFFSEVLRALRDDLAGLMGPCPMEADSLGTTIRLHTGTKVVGLAEAFF